MKDFEDLIDELVNYVTKFESYLFLVIIGLVCLGIYIFFKVI